MDAGRFDAGFDSGPMVPDSGFDGGVDAGDASSDASDAATDAVAE